ncbi:hypothetical protein GCM10010343_62890 [Streptomyces avidinii]|nr:hypothetical protein GCM10010343_62890 [Streptomyces avidinii]
MILGADAKRPQLPGLDAPAEAGVEEVDTGGGDGDADLAGGGNGDVRVLVGEVLGGAEGVEADGAHGGHDDHGATSSGVEVKGRRCRPLSVGWFTMGGWCAKDSRGSSRR